MTKQKKNKALSVWDWSYRPSYYFLRPWKWVKELIVNIKNAHDRMHYGYCCVDWFNFNSWFMTIAPPMLREIADNGYAYPGSEPFETPEKWHDWLRKMADRLEQSTEEWEMDHPELNEYAAEYEKAYKEAERKMGDKDDDPNNYLTTPGKIARRKYLDREEEIMNNRQKLFIDTMTELLEHWWCLWD